MTQLRNRLSAKYSDNLQFLSSIPESECIKLYDRQRSVELSTVVDLGVEPKGNAPVTCKRRATDSLVRQNSGLVELMLSEGALQISCEEFIKLHDGQWSVGLSTAVDLAVDAKGNAPVTKAKKIMFAAQIDAYKLDSVEGTAEFCRVMNDAFDIQNRRSVKA